MARTTFDHQQNEFWIIGFFSWDKSLFYRVEIGEQDFGVEMISKNPGSQSRSIGLKGGLIIEPVSSINIERFASGSLALDQFIYTAGGCDPRVINPYERIPSRYIYCLDTANLNKDWKKLDAEMKIGRQSPQLAALQGKIYLFGGAIIMGSFPPSEVYDAVTGIINELPVDNYTNDLRFLGVDHVFKRFLFCSVFCNSRAEFSYLVFYYPETHEWAKEETHGIVARHLHELLTRTHVVVGTTIYWLSMNFEIKAYDFVQKKFYFSGELKCRPKQKQGHPGWFDPRWWDDSFVPSFLFHMNGDCFCLFWDASEYSSDENTGIHCTGLKIISSSDTDSDSEYNLLSVSVLGTQTYLISGGRGLTVTNILPVCRKKDIPLIG